MQENKKPVLLSGIQPSGQLVLGNYIGALKHWVALQDSCDCLFMLPDLHTITVRQDPAELRERCYSFLALYIACGIDPEKSIIFLQSHVPAHSQLAWILSCYTQMGELNRMTQFKDKSARHESNINAGLFAYPSLMAADVLLYGTNLVPVGDDQKQHLELARDIALRFNHLYGDIFVLPEPLIPELGARIMGLQDPNKKMSKSDVNEGNFIAILDSPEKIRHKMKRAVTDSEGGVHFDSISKPGVANLLTLYSVLSERPIKEIEAQYLGKGYGIFKEELAAILLGFLSPIQARYHVLRADQEKLRKIFQHGASLARARSTLLLNKVHAALGFIVD
jgi:tryptophanyl-tRNA synthetase